MSKEKKDFVEHSLKCLQDSIDNYGWIIEQMNRPDQLKQLIKQTPNDTELGKLIRERYGDTK